MSKRQETPIKKNAFVHKLYSMLNDPELSNLIWWTREEDSNTFALSPGKDFANALTRYFKHGNVASFVRQLHMYGFHKVSDPSHANTAANNDSELPVWEFKHSSGKFKKNDEGSLVYIKRRSSSNNARNVYNNENDANIVIPTSTPSPEHAQYLQEGHHYLPQGYYFYNGHQVTHHMSPQLPFPPGGAPIPLHQSKQPPMYYTQKPMPSSIPHDYAQESTLEKPKLADIQRSISPQSQPNLQHQVPQVSKPLPMAHIQPPMSQAQSQTLQDMTKPHYSHPDVQDTQQPQHYTPNLQFRKIWENDNLHSRPRNPSLLFDPLAPVPVTSQLQPLHQLQNTEQQPQSSFSYLLSRSDSRSSYASARESITSTRDSFASNRDSIASGRESLASAKDSFSSTRDSFSSARDSFGNSKDSFTLSKDSDRLSIKLPPPSSIHNPSFYTNTSNSPFSSVSETNSQISTITTSNPPKAPSKDSPSPSSSTSTSTIKVKSNSIPETSTTAKRPSIFPSHSVHEKLRPSLIELHFGTSSKASILNPQHDSIGSQSSHNSVFSNNSSLSSTSSFHRTSSFGSISHHPIFSNKNSISIAPHELVPNTLLSRPRLSNPEPEVNSESKDCTPNLKSPKVLQMNSPIKRSSTTAIPTINGGATALKIRSLNSSPLSRLLTNEELIAGESSNAKALNTKVSIHSLLDDDQRNDKVLLPSKGNTNAGLREVKEVINELNEEKDINEDDEVKDIQLHSNGNDSQNSHNNIQNSKSLVDLKRQKLD